MAQQVTQSVAASLLNLLTDLNGNPKAGLTFSDVTCQFIKQDQSSFTAKVLDGTNFIEVGNGYYTIGFTDVELNTLGNFLWLVNGTGLQTFDGYAVVNPVTAATNVLPDVLTCVISGNIIDLSSKPIEGVAVSARVLGFPTTSTITSSSYGVTDDLLSAITDQNGFFSLELIRNTTVQIFIPRINYTRILTVPNAANKNLFQI